MEYEPITSGFKDPEVAAEFRRLAQALIANVHRLPIVYVAPTDPTDGDICIPDGTSWDPLGGGGAKQPVWYDGTSATWKAI